LTLVLRSSQTTAACPACAQPSNQVHGHYTRRLADLPCQQRPVHVCLEVRRFRCATRGCPRTTFAERFPTLTHAYARRTLRQAEFLTEIAFAKGEAKPGRSWRSAWGCRPVAIRGSRLMRGSEIPKRKTPRVLGLDDFAWKKGDRYGTRHGRLRGAVPGGSAGRSGSRFRGPLVTRTPRGQTHQS
jgi:transposase